MARRKIKQPQKKYDLIVPESKRGGTKEGTEIYLVIAQAIEQYKDSTHRAGVFGAAWMIGQKKNRDGLLILGKMKRCSELEKQLHGYDGLVLLNQEAWRTMTPEQRIALVHHELCHIEPVMDAEGDEQLYDGHGNLRWRVRKHDIEEFREVVEAHGLYKDDLRRFVGVAIKRAEAPALPGMESEAPMATPIPASAKSRRRAQPAAESGPH